MHFHPQLATSALSASSFIPFNEPTLSHLRLFHYWVHPHLDVLYCLTNYYGSSFHAFEALVLELSSCRPNTERTNNIFNAAWPYMACSQFIYRQSSFLFRHLWQSSFLFRSGSLSARLFPIQMHRCTVASVYLYLPSIMSYGNSIPLSLLILFSFMSRQSWSVLMITARLTSCARLISTFHVLVSYRLSPLAVVISKTFLIQLLGSDCSRLIIRHRSQHRCI